MSVARRLSELERAAALLTSAPAIEAALFAERVASPAVIVRVTPRTRLATPCSRDELARTLRGTGMKMPPPGGVVVLVVDEKGPAACGRVRSAPLSPGGQA